MRSSPIFVAAVLAAALTACGGGSSAPPPTSPSPTPNLPAGGACGAIGTAIVNGSDCPNTNASVVLVNMRADDGGPAGSCSGTVIAPRAVLTAAHCLVGNVAKVQIFLGTGPQIVASSFAAYPGYRETDPNGLDVGVVLFADDIGRAPVPVLLSRDARVGETAIIAGWGRNQDIIGSTLRAGVTTISAVGPALLQTQFSTSSASVCAGDSGGPLLLSEGGTWGVAGINSAVTNAVCNSGTNFYAKVRNPDIANFITSRVPDARRL